MFRILIVFLLFFSFSTVPNVVNAHAQLSIYCGKKKVSLSKLNKTGKISCSSHQKKSKKEKKPQDFEKKSNKEKGSDIQDDHEKVNEEKNSK